VVQAWRANRIPKFPQGADTKSVALFTEITVGVDSKGEIVKLKWLGYTVEKGNIRTPVLVEEHLLQHTLFVRPTNPEGTNDDRCGGTWMGCCSVVRKSVLSNVWIFLDGASFSLVSTENFNLLERCLTTDNRPSLSNQDGQYGHRFQFAEAGSERELFIRNSPNLFVAVEDGRENNGNACTSGKEHNCRRTKSDGQSRGLCPEAGNIQSSHGVSEHQTNDRSVCSGSQTQTIFSSLNSEWTKRARAGRFTILLARRDGIHITSGATNTQNPPEVMAVRRTGSDGGARMAIQIVWNLLPVGVLAQVRLGETEKILRPGVSMSENGNKLPLGQKIIASVCYW
jgi:hypothetical protein